MTAGSKSREGEFTFREYAVAAAAVPASDTHLVVAKTPEMVTSGSSKSNVGVVTRPPPPAIASMQPAVKAAAKAAPAPKGESSENIYGRNSGCKK